MTRRMFFLLPDVKHAMLVVDDLIINGVNYRNIHSVARHDVDISKLPPSSKLQKKNYTYLIEHFLWAGNLLLFFISFVLVIYLLTWSTPVVALIPLAIMLICYNSGKYYATKIPHTHLSEFSSALEHREILLMVDVPKDRVRDIARAVHRQHPEVVVGGVGWAVEALHI